MQQSPRILIMAGGTGGHITPGLAIAKELQRRGWHVSWLGNPQKMEGQLVPAQGIELEPMNFAGLRGKGIMSLVMLPIKLSKACWQARQAIKKVKPDVVLGMGGYVAVPGGLMAKLGGIPLVIHEANSVAGSANKLLAKFANAKLSGFPDVLPGAHMVGNPVRQEFLQAESPSQRYGQRQGRLKVLVVGGSQGALMLNTIVPEAISLLPAATRPEITHQAGQQHIEQLKRTYENYHVDAHCVPFIDNMAKVVAEADLLICRAGAMTVAEVAAIGVAALFVPLPGAIDDHQTGNANWLAKQGAAVIRVQGQLSAAWLSDWLRQQQRVNLQQIAEKAHAMAMPLATQSIAQVCAELVKD